MIFDQFCGLVERHFPNLRRYAESARIFHFPGKAHEILPHTMENADYFLENFFLPFRTVAIEDPASMIILFDPEPEARGLGIKRMFIECTPIGQAGGNFYDSDRLDNEVQDGYRELAKQYGELWHVTKGWLSFLGYKENTWRIGGHVDYVALVSMKSLINEYTKGLDELDASILRNISTAFEELMYFNSPDRFILEETPLGALQKRGTGAARAKIPRSHDRPVYTILEPTEIRQKLNLPIERTGTHASPVPHDRRAHPRTLRSEKFKNKKGQTIIIPATWVGVSEVTRGNKRYKILLDR